MLVWLRIRWGKGRGVVWLRIRWGKGLVGKGSGAGPRVSPHVASDRPKTRPAPRRKTFPISKALSDPWLGLKADVLVHGPEPTSERPVSLIRFGPTSEPLFPTLYRRTGLFSTFASETAGQFLRIPSEQQTPAISGASELEHRITVSFLSFILTLLCTLKSPKKSVL